MDATELRQMLSALGISQVDLGRLLKVTPRGVNLWVAGEREVPGPVAAYLQLLASLPKALQAQELTRLAKDAIVIEGMYGISFQGAAGAGIGCVVLMAGRVFGSDGGVLYDGTYQPSSKQGYVDAAIRISVPPGVPLVQGVPAKPMPYSFDLTASFPARGTAAISVATPYGSVQAQVRFLRDVPRELAA